MGNSDRKPGLIKRLWKWWRTPSRLALGTLLLIGFVGGIVRALVANRRRIILSVWRIWRQLPNPSRASNNPMPFKPAAKFVLR